MKQVNIHEAKTTLSKLLAAVANGEEVVIARAGKPVAKLVAIPGQEKRLQLRPIGQMDGQVWISDDFDAPLPDDIQAAFEGRA